MQLSGSHMLHYRRLDNHPTYYAKNKESQLLLLQQFCVICVICVIW